MIRKTSSVGSKKKRANLRKPTAEVINRVVPKDSISLGFSLSDYESVVKSTFRMYSRCTSLALLLKTFKFGSR